MKEIKAVLKTLVIRVSLCIAFMWMLTQPSYEAILAFMGICIALVLDGN